MLKRSLFVCLAFFLSSHVAQAVSQEELLAKLKSPPFQKHYEKLMIADEEAEKVAQSNMTPDAIQRRENEREAIKNLKPISQKIAEEEFSKRTGYAPYHFEIRKDQILNELMKGSVGKDQLNIQLTEVNT